MGRRLTDVTANDHCGRVVAASVAGTSHVKLDKECEDVHGWRRLRNGLLAVALADGAGSALNGGEGAAIAVKAALADLVRSVEQFRGMDGEWETALLSALQMASEAVEEHAANSGRPIRSYASTLLLSLIERNRIGVAQIGDGGSVLLTGSGTLQTITRPPLTEYVNETLFLISPNAIETAQLAIFEEPLLSAAFFTDGLQRLALKLPEGAPFPPFFSPLFKFAETVSEKEAITQLESFLQSPRVTERTDDDLTLLLISIKQSPRRFTESC